MPFYRSTKTHMPVHIMHLAPAANLQSGNAPALSPSLITSISPLISYSASSPIAFEFPGCNTPNHSSSPELLGQDWADRWEVELGDRDEMEQLCKEIGSTLKIPKGPQPECTKDVDHSAKILIPQVHRSARVDGLNRQLPKLTTCEKVDTPSSTYDSQLGHDTEKLRTFCISHQVELIRAIHCQQDLQELSRLYRLRDDLCEDLVIHDPFEQLDFTCSCPNDSDGCSRCSLSIVHTMSDQQVDNFMIVQHLIFRLERYTDSKVAEQDEEYMEFRQDMLEYQETIRIEYPSEESLKLDSLARELVPPTSPKEGETADLHFLRQQSSELRVKQRMLHSTIQILQTKRSNFSKQNDELQSERHEGEMRIFMKLLNKSDVYQMGTCLVLLRRTAEQLENIYEKLLPTGPSSSSQAEQYRKCVEEARLWLENEDKERVAPSTVSGAASGIRSLREAAVEMLSRQEMLSKQVSELEHNLECLADYIDSLRSEGYEDEIECVEQIAKDMTGIMEGSVHELSELENGLKVVNETLDKAEESLLLGHWTYKENPFKNPRSVSSSRESSNISPMTMPRLQNLKRKRGRVDTKEGSDSKRLRQR